MRIVGFAMLVAALPALSCGRGETAAQFTLRQDRIEHVEGCHVKMLNAAYHKDPPFVGMKFVCGLPESDLDGWSKDDPKWSTHPTPPLAFTMSVGDCVRLNETFYCVASIKPGEAVFQATFKQQKGDDALITRISP